MHKACPQFLTNVYFKGSDLYYIFSALILHDFPWPKICKFVTYRHWIGGSRELSVWQSWTVSATVCNCQRQKSGCFLKVVANTAFRFVIQIDSLISFGQIDSNRFVLLKNRLFDLAAAFAWSMISLCEIQRQSIPYSAVVFCTDFNVCGTCATIVVTVSS